MRTLGTLWRDGLLIFATSSDSARAGEKNGCDLLEGEYIVVMSAGS